MRSAFVLSGGGSLGADQVGMLQALAARGIAPDRLDGTSAGTLNGALVAGHGPSRHCTIWRDLDGSTSGATTDRLEDGADRLPDPERFLSLHDHPRLTNHVSCPGDAAGMTGGVPHDR